VPPRTPSPFPSRPQRFRTAEGTSASTRTGPFGRGHTSLNIAKPIDGGAIIERALLLRGQKRHKHPEGLPRLKRLLLIHTQITETGIANLKDMTNLEVLRLGGTSVGDVELAQLKRLTALKILGLSGTQVTDDGVREFQGALPNVKIVR
jgi:hypothetical protein